VNPVHGDVRAALNEKFDLYSEYKCFECRWLNIDVCNILLSTRATNLSMPEIHVATLQTDGGT